MGRIARRAEAGMTSCLFYLSLCSIAFETCLVV
jgi:hypothetical protein